MFGVIDIIMSCIFITIQMANTRPCETQDILEAVGLIAKRVRHQINKAKLIRDCLLYPVLSPNIYMATCLAHS